MITIKTNMSKSEIKRVILLLCDGTHRYTQIMICRKTGGIRHSGKAIDLLVELSGRHG